MTKVEQLSKCWNQLPLSVAGQINSIKMSTLPKCTYLFQNIPIFLPKFFFFINWTELFGHSFGIINPLELGKAFWCDPGVLVAWLFQISNPTIGHAPCCIGYMKTLVLMHFLGSFLSLSHVSTPHWQLLFKHLSHYHTQLTQLTCWSKLLWKCGPR